MHLSASYPRANSQYALYSFICFSFWPTGHLSPEAGGGDTCRIAQETPRCSAVRYAKKRCQCNQHTAKHSEAQTLFLFMAESLCRPETVGNEALQADQVTKLFRRFTRQRAPPVIAVPHRQRILQAPAQGLLAGVWQPPCEA